ncbi:MAG: ATP-dependent Clp protease ATP-binding subunit ClpB, partial [Flavobacteriales bacterium]
MDFEKLTIKSQQAIQEAQQIASGNSQQAVDTAHLLKGILKVDENVTPYLMEKLEVNDVIFKQALDRIIASYPSVEGGDLHLSRSLNTVLVKAGNLIKDFKDEYVSIEHLLMALASGSDTTANMMKDSGMVPKNLKLAILDLRKGQNVTSSGAE